MGEKDTAQATTGDIQVIASPAPGLAEGMRAPWQPGQSGNPKGRPPDAERLLARMLRRHEGVLDRAADELARVLSDGDHRHWLGALREALDRIDGPVTKQHEHQITAVERRKVRIVDAETLAEPPPEG